MANRIFKYFGILLLFNILLAGCKKWIEVEAPPDQIVASKVFDTDSKAEAAVSAVYANIVNGTGLHLNHKLLTLYGGFASDEFTHYSPNANMRAFLNNELTASNSIVRNFWSSSYETIYYSNVCIEGISQSNTISTSLQKRLVAEMKFVRAWQYFYLVQLFGDVPLVTTTNYQQNALVFRADSAQIFQQIVEDLEDASTVLPESFDQNEKVRPTKWAAFALLSKVYLLQERWSDAESAASRVISSPLFGPLPAAEQVFLKNSDEAIWQLRPVNPILPLITDWMAFSVPRVTLSPQLVEALEPGDNRWHWVDSIDRAGRRYYYPVKYRNLTSSITEYFMVLRLADVLLVRSEARARQELVEPALQDLNVVRHRAGLAAIGSSMSTADLLNQIWRERFCELWGEHGDRWLTLKRTGRAIEVLGIVKPGIQTSDLLFPIPIVELGNNPNLFQNPGY